MSREAVDEVEQLRHELDEERDRRLRRLAEFDNFRRRAARERETAGAEGRRVALRPLLAVLDTLERALAAGSSDRDFYDGVAATHRLFVDAVLHEHFATPGTCEESTLIDQEFGLYDEATSNRTRSEIYAEAFPATT